jgi:hypothetical protein
VLDRVWVPNQTKENNKSKKSKKKHEDDVEVDRIKNIKFSTINLEWFSVVLGSLLQESQMMFCAYFYFAAC